MAELGEGNDDEDIRADFERWTESLWPALARATGGADDDEGCVAGAVPEVSFQSEMLSGDKATSDLEWLGRAFPKLQVYRCAVVDIRELTSDPSYDSGSVVHVELACEGVRPGGANATLRYETADDLGVCCDNGRDLAATAASLLGLDLAAAFVLRPLPSAAGMAPPLPTPWSMTARVEPGALRLTAAMAAHRLLLVSPRHTP